MSKWTKHTYNWKRQEERDKAVFKLWVVWLPHAAKKRKVMNQNGTRPYYGKYLMPDFGEKQLINIVNKYPTEYHKAYLYKNRELYRAWKHLGIEMDVKQILKYARPNNR